MSKPTSNVLHETMQNLSESIKATSDEIRYLKDELGDISKELLESSNKMYKASKYYFAGSIVLTLILVLATCIIAYTSWQSRVNPCQKNRIQNTVLGTPEGEYRTQ